MKTFSIVIPTYNHYDLLHQFLFDIYKSCPSITEVLVVNNGSTDETVQGLEWWKSSGMLPIREIRLTKNVGFLKASNIGLQKAVGDIVVLLSNDVRVHSNILSSLSLVDDKNEKWLAGGRLLNWDTGWNQFNGHIYPYLEGWLLATTNDGWKDLGYFDERYAPNDFEDVDITTTALSKGYKLHELQTQCSLEHIGAQSIGYNPERESITFINQEKFRKKWVMNEG